MPCDNSMGGGSLAALNLPAEHVSFLRDEMTGWLDSLRSDLRTPERLEDPDRTRREVEALERLLIGLTTGQVFIPDEEGEALLRAALASHDKENGYQEVIAAHDAMHGLLVVLEGGES
ncbi:MAG TPA: hypothetical protein VFT19_03620 [Solirubrobacterales bacterium]|nr:hypothetical protein [Solirubrobacterales bacterium]